MVYPSGASKTHHMRSIPVICRRVISPSKEEPDTIRSATPPWRSGSLAPPRLDTSSLPSPQRAPPWPSSTGPAERQPPRPAPPASSPAPERSLRRTTRSSRPAHQQHDRSDSGQAPTGKPSYCIFAGNTLRTATTVADLR